MEYTSAKAEEKNPSYDLEDDPLWDFLSGGSDIDDIYEQVIDEIKELDSLYRDIMIDREINGMKYKDIADKYGLTPELIKAEVAKAKSGEAIVAKARGGYMKKKKGGDMAMVHAGGGGEGVGTFARGGKVLSVF